MTADIKKVYLYSCYHFACPEVALNKDIDLIQIIIVNEGVPGTKPSMSLSRLLREPGTARNG